MDADIFISRMNEYYRRRAPYHDQYMSYAGNEKMEALLRPIVGVVEEIISDRSVLEIACGTGNWTQILARRACRVVATDINQEVLDIATTKECAGDVVFKVADAYDLADLEGGFEAAFASDWWSHMPKSMIRRFLESLMDKILPGGRVIMLDMLPAPGLKLEEHTFDEGGNFYSYRTLPTGERLPVIKNFPIEGELKNALLGFALDFQYYIFAELKRWMVVFTI